MEALLPLSAGIKPGGVESSSPSSSKRGSKTGALPIIPAASVTLPLFFMVTGLLALLASVAWLVAQPEILAAYHYSPTAVAVTHLFVLGWIGSIVMGAIYQLVPVALETKLYSERLARWQYVFHVVGFAGMIWMFRAWNMKMAGYFGGLVGIGVALFVYNVGRTLLRVPKWNVVAATVASALGWILLTVTAGLILVTAKFSAVTGFVLRFNPIAAMHAHAHLGVIGFFVMLIVGVSYKLIPMFTLSEIQNARRAATSILLLNIGLAGSFATILLQSPWKVAFAAVVALALALYGFEMKAILHARKRRELDWGIRYFLVAISLLAPLSVIAIVLSWPGLPVNQFTMQLENVYGFLGLVGVVSFAIIGMLYKIIPFLVWFGVYSRHIGRAKVPALAEMYSARLQVFGCAAFLTGLIITGAAILFSNAAAARIGSGILGTSFMTLAMNVGLMLRHQMRPQLAPLASPSARKNTIRTVSSK